MARTLEARLSRLRAQIGWRLTTLTDRRGREITVPTFDLLDAWLGLVLHGKSPALSLSRRVSVFLAGARVRGHDGEMLNALRDACRAYWHADREGKR